jgi:hypothetical protein
MTSLKVLWLFLVTVMDLDLREYGPGMVSLIDLVWVVGQGGDGSEEEGEEVVRIGWVFCGGNFIG